MVTSPSLGGATCGGGRFQLGELLFGDWDRGLYRGRDAETGARVLISAGPPQVDLAGAARLQSFALPRVSTLLFVGPLDPGAAVAGDALVESEPAGVRASEALRLPVDPATAKWILLEVARICEAANAAGVTLSGIRPELIHLWGTVPQVLGIAPRCEPFLAGARSTSQGRMPVFRDLYASPEVLTWPTGAAPAHADAFSIAALAAHWLSGVHPFPGEGMWQAMSIMTGKRAPWTGDDDDGEALASFLARDLADRLELDSLMSWLE